MRRDLRRLTVRALRTAVRAHRTAPPTLLRGRRVRYEREPENTTAHAPVGPRLNRLLH